MDKNIKATLTKIVENGTLEDVQNAFTRHAFYLDHTYFDYELLKSALVRGDSEIANHLLKLGCRVIRPDEKNPEESLLHLVVKNIKQGTCDLARRLISKSKGALIYHKNASGDTPLVVAYKAERYAVVQYLLKQCTLRRLDPTNKDDIVHFQVSIISCAIDNDLRVVQTFLESGFDPNAPFLLDLDECAGLNPINFSIRNYYFGLFTVLLQKCDLSVKDFEGLTPLHTIYYFIKECEMEDWMIRAVKESDNLALNNCEDRYGLSHFHLCCILNNSKLVQAFIDNGANVNSPVSIKSVKNAGFTPLHFALRYNRFPDVIKVLLKNGADPNKKDKKGRTPLHLVSKKDTISSEWFCDLYIFEIIQIMLGFKAELTIPDEKGCTPLHVLFKYFHYIRDYERKTDTFAKIISKIPWGSINYSDKFGISLFHIACCINHIDQVVRFLDAGVDVDSRINTDGYTSGYTALHFATIYKQADIVEELLRRNADVNARTDDSNSTPLHLVCKCYLKRERFRGDGIVADQLKIVRLLISHGADVNARDSLGFTPLLFTCVINQNDQTCLDGLPDYEMNALTRVIKVRWYEIFKILLLNNADVNARTDNQTSILHILGKYKFLKISEKLVDKIMCSGADVNAIDDNGLTPLHVAVDCENIAVVKNLLLNSANPNIRCKNSRIPLHIIVGKIINKNCQFQQSSSNYILEVLLDYDSDTNALDNNGNTFLHLAVSNFSYKMTEKLLLYGIDVNVENGSGNCCISELLKYLERRNYRVYSWLHLFRIIYIHVQKLMALRLPLSQRLKNSCALLYSHYKMEPSMVETLPVLDRTFQECVNELATMKNINIDRYTSLYDILLKSPQELAIHLKNDNLCNILHNSNIEEDFPNYSYLLKVQYKRGKKRSDVLMCAEEALSNILKVDLPDVCYETIFKYLDDEEITVLKEVAL